MKIQGDRPSGVQDAGQTQQVDKAAQQRGQQARGAADTGDRVEVSADARLLHGLPDRQGGGAGTSDEDRGGMRILPDRSRRH